jgi:transposase
MSIIAFDSHKRYTWARIEDEDGNNVQECRIEHRRGNIAGFLLQQEGGSAVALETIGNWYWIVDEIERAGMRPVLVHAGKAKLMMGCINKTDKLDAKGLNMLQRVGRLPKVWIPPGDIRDKRELPRVRMVFGNARTKLKNRIHSVLDKYGLQDEFEDISDIFGVKGIQRLNRVIEQLPEQTYYTTVLLLDHLEQTQQKINRIEERMKELFEETPQSMLVKTLPGVGFILAVVIIQEVGDIGRFSGAECFASYCGTTPRVHASGGKVRYGRLRPDTNHYLKWAFSEAGNSVALNSRRLPDRHVSQLYNRIRHRRNHGKAIGAVARHLAEATYWVLSKGEAYRERGLLEVSSTGA